MREYNKNILGFTLTEMLVAMAIMVILMAAAVPTIKKLREAMEQSTGVKSIIDAALSNARAIAVREQKYAGVRFQLHEGRQYLMLIINDPNGTGLVNGFRMVDGRKSVMLPDGVAIISEKYKKDSDLKTPAKFVEASLVSIIFTPAGKLTTHDVRYKGQLQFGNSVLPWDDNSDYSSIVSFRIYDIKELAKFTSSPWDGYLKNLNTEHINPYTGELIRKE